MKPLVVVSAVNVVELGPLSILRDALRVLSAHYCDEYEVVALVHRRALFEIPGIKFLEYPKIKSSWFKRLKFEFFELQKLSRELHPYLWLSMHDVSPSVNATVRAVYCHNASPFYQFRFRDLLLDWKFAAFTLFYGYLYGINIRKNSWVIVQQDWLRQAFRRRYGIDRIIVAHPEEADSHPSKVISTKKKFEREDYCFFYPCFPRVFKNIETLLSAAQILEEDGSLSFELWLTFDGSENRYAAQLARRFSFLKRVKLLGMLTRDQVFERYARTDCLVFPSRLETWGMPISEFKAFHKSMLVADLPYAHETVGGYDKIAFFAPTAPQLLADKMRAAAEGEMIFGQVRAPKIKRPYCKSWRELFGMLLPNSAVSKIEQIEP